MKYPLFVSFCVILCIGSGCTQTKVVDTLPPPKEAPTAVTQLEEVIPLRGPIQPGQTRGMEDIMGSVYHGSYFDIIVPDGFSVSPQTPLSGAEKNSIILTNEAFFTAPDESIIFYVYSPLWRGEPAYLEAKKDEILVSEKTETSGGKSILWRTFQDTNMAYYRSLVSIREEIGTGNEVHHIFGIQYKDQAAYDTYKDTYTAFKESLVQYAD